MMQIAGAIVDLIDVQGSSVMVCLEDGWDFTTQVRNQDFSQTGMTKWPDTPTEEARGVWPFQFAGEMARHEVNKKSVLK